MSRLFTILAAANGFIAVAFGAFGAHRLKEILPSEALHAFDTAVRYQMIHALALFGVALLLQRAPSHLLQASGWAFFAGMILFSGSLYILALGGPGWLGPVTPLGGLSFLVGWGLLVWVAVTRETI